jgi:hypothetical protein
MKKILLSLLLVFSILGLKAQTSEFSIQANGGMSHDVGNGTVSSTNLNVDGGNSHGGYPNGDGNRYAFSYGLGLQWQYVFKCNFLLGLQAGYEVVSNKVNIDGVYDGASTETPATGYVTDHNGFININPSIGYRLHFNKVRFDILPGFDIALGMHGSETVNVKASDNTYYNRPLNDLNSKPTDDFRLRLGLAAYYKKFGINASYSHGLHNYNSDELADEPVPALNVNVIRLGISYRIK